MFYNIHLETNNQDFYTFGAKTNAIAHKSLCENIFSEFWNGFCCTNGEIFFTPTKKLLFEIGESENIQQPENGYVLSVSKTGVTLIASDEKNLINGFFALLERIRPHKNSFKIPCCFLQEKATVSTRMVHLCIFPETPLFFVKKFIRTSAFFRYTHIIVEFWGMLKYDCQKELAWSNAYSKEELRPLFEEARSLGLQVVPMFNHWGHASASRVAQGKHVVLDQNPKLAQLFSISGWNWKLSNSEVRILHQKIRNELIELCGDGEYFHIGCDEAYGITSTEEFLEIAEYINDISDELQAKGRKAIMWGDMLLHAKTLDQQTKNRYALLCPSEDMQKILLEKLSRSVIIADWEYDATEYPIETALFFKKQGFEVFCCPWDRSHSNLVATAKTIKNHNIQGLIHTTWHTLSSGSGFPMVAFMSELAWNKENTLPADHGHFLAYIASLLRKICPVNGDYANAGWAEKQIQEYL